MFRAEVARVDRVSRDVSRDVSLNPRDSRSHSASPSADETHALIVGN